MHSANEILQTAESVRSRFGTGNPFQLAAMCGAEIMVCELGRLKGLYKIVLRNAFIALNAALQREEAAAVCAHELGHHILHRLTRHPASPTHLYFHKSAGRNMKPISSPRNC